MMSQRESDAGRRADAVEWPRVRLGFVPLTDCAPLAIARERGFFRDEGVDVELSREPSWANVRDKLAVGALDGAQLLAPMSLSTSLGVDAVDVPLVVPMCLDLNGNAITLSTRLADRLSVRTPINVADPMSAGLALKELVDEEREQGHAPLVLAVAFRFSSHNYALRYWLAAAGIDPDRDVRILVAPPPTMVSMLEQGSIDGYCVGEPWNAMARAHGSGRTLATSFDIWPAAPEKVLALRRHWAAENPRTTQALVRALIRAGQWLDDMSHRQEAVHVIAGLSHVDAPVDVVAQSMGGRCEDALGRIRRIPDMHVFYRYTATFPWRSHAAWFVAQMIRWGHVEESADFESVIESVYRPDLYREAAKRLGIAAPTIDWKIEGAHAEPWLLEDATVPIPMARDRFIDDLVFDPHRLAGYLEKQEISSLCIRPDDLPARIGPAEQARTI